MMAIYCICPRCGKRWLEAQDKSGNDGITIILCQNCESGVEVFDARKNAQLPTVRNPHEFGNSQ